jgi:hypothetical protein
MKLNELEKMAKETAAFGVHPSGEYIYSFYTEQLQAFAELVAQHEREACANVAKEISDKYAYGYYGNQVDTADEIEDAIRARGQA